MRMEVKVRMKQVVKRVLAIMIAIVLVMSGINIPSYRVNAAEIQTSTNSNSDEVKATLVEKASNDGYWYEYNIIVSNSSSQSVCKWVIKASLSSPNLEGLESWNTCNVTYKEGYLYIEGAGDGSVVAAGSDNSRYSVKFGLGRSIGLDTSDIVSITYEYGSEANAGVDDFEFNYSLTGQTKDLDFEDTPVGRHGKLHVDGIYLYDENDEKMQLRGASLHGLQWDVGQNYINKGAFQSLRDEWGINAIRLPVYVTQSGYTEGASATMDTYIQNAVNYATELGMYVLIDWHVHSASGETTNPNTWKSQANTFFDKYASMYKDYDNVLFEICNEPVNTKWYDGSGNDLYSYANAIIPTIRQYTDAVVIVGTNTWSQDVDEVAAHKLTTSNTMYTIHFYSATHMSNIRSKVQTALNAGVPIFCTEFGVCSADGNGSYNLTEADAWMDLFDQYSISYFCWQLSNKNEKSSYLAANSTKTTGGWVNSDLSTTGMWLINENRPKADAEDEKYASNIETGETVDLAVTGTFNYEMAYEVLELTNAERAKVGLNPLTMDKDLLDAAMLRAAESAVYFDHTRPNGKEWRSVSNKMYGENIAVNYTNAAAAVNQWMNSTSGHKEAMLSSSYYSIGVGVFYQDGYIFYVQCFGFNDITTVSKPANVEKTIDIEVLKSSLNEASISFDSSNYSVKANNTKKANVKMTNWDWASASVKLDPSNFTYSVDSTAIVTVSDGVITPVSNGTTTLTAKLNVIPTKKVTASVTASGFVESVSLDKSMMTLDTNGTKTATLTATVSPTTAVDKTVSYSSSNDNVATVNTNGVVTAVAPGTATITVTTNCGNKTDTCEVTVWETQNAPDAPTLETATTNSIVLTAVDGCEYSMDKTVWTTNNAFTGLEPNTEYTFYARKAASGYYKVSPASESAKFKTLPILVTGISLDKKELKIDEGDVSKLTATIEPDNASNKNYTWKSDKTTIATVDSSGNVKGISPGSAIVTVTTADGGKTADCTVLVYGTYEAPKAPTVSKVTATTVKLEYVAGYLYSKDGDTWQTDYEFTDLTPNTEYTFYVKKVGSGYYHESPVSEGTTVKTEPIYVTSVSIEQESLALEIGGDNEILTGKLTATITPNNATTKKVTWKSDNIAVATVDSSGNVTAVGPGTATITVTAAGGQSPQPYDTCTVTIWKTPKVPTQAPSTSATPTKDTIILTPYEGCEYRIAPDGQWQDSNVFNGLEPETEYTFDIRVKGDDEKNIKPGDVVSVVITTAREGVKVVEVTGVAFDNKLSESCTITMGDATSWSFTAKVSPDNATDKTITYESSNPQVATIDENGKVIAIAPGETVLKVITKIGGFEDTIKLTVKKKYDKPAAPTLKSKTTTTVTLNKVDGCQYSKDGATWQSSNVFTGLSPDTKYTFYVKKVASEYWLESDISNGLEVSTDKETTGGSTGGTTGGETSGSTGDSTGGMTGGESGGSTGGATGGETGGTTGGETGGSTDGSTDGSIGGSTGGDTGSTSGSNDGEDSGTAEPFVVPNVNVNYRTHIQTYGWEGEDDDIKTWESNGSMSGTSGESKRLEGINIVVNPATNCPDLDLGIQYTTHCQSYGWLPWSADGDMNGTEGESKRLEAIMIQLTGEHADYYDVYYRVHAQNYGWLGWAKNGQPAGTAGYSKRLEGIQIVVVKKDESFNHNVGGINSAYDIPFDAKEGSSPIVNYPSTSNTNPIVPGTEDVNVAYRTHVQTYGWQGWKYNGQMSGTSGESKRLEGIEMKLTNKDYEGGIAYTTHVQTYGWQGTDLDDPSTWKTNGEMAGTKGESKRLEAICITLTGEMADHYDIYYRVHAQTYGWLGWACNGEPAGTAGLSRRLEGIQIVVVPKGEGEPANTYMDVTSDNTKAYIEK